MTVEWMDESLGIIMDQLRAFKKRTDGRFADALVQERIAQFEGLVIQAKHSAIQLETAMSLWEAKRNRLAGDLNAELGRMGSEEVPF